MEPNQGSPAHRRSRLSSRRANHSEKAISIRDSLVWELRQKGYCFREIGDFLGITKQRVSQIERRVNQLQIAFFQTFCDEQNMKELTSIRIRGRMPARFVSMAEFNRRLDALNEKYERAFLNILERHNRRLKLPSRKHCPPFKAPLFWKVWPCIERYSFKPFSYSGLIGDYPHLAREPLLAQLLSRLRKQRLLQSVGSVRVEGHNFPEILMIQATVEQYVRPSIERLVVRWSTGLLKFRHTYTPTLPSHSIDSFRESLMQLPTTHGRAAFEFPEVRFIEENASRPSLKRTSAARQHNSATGKSDRGTIDSDGARGSLPKSRHESQRY